MAGLHLKWGLTWPDGDPDDARADLSVARSDQGGGQWSWVLDERTILGSSTAETARAAALVAEAAWFAHRDS